MPKEIRTVYTAGNNLYIVILDNQGCIWNGVEFTEDIEAENWTDYAIQADPVLGTNIYFFDFPTEITISARYTIICYLKLGAVPSSSDTAIQIGEINWGGKSEITGQDVLMEEVSKLNN